MIRIIQAVILLRRIPVKKTYDAQGNWSHEEIVLHPKNPDYSPIIIDEENADEFRIVGEFIGILQAEIK